MGEVNSEGSLSAVPVSWEVFLSSTIQDFSEYRRAIQDALLKEAETTCFLSEDWVTGFSSTVQQCCDRVQRSSAFLLLLGYWYGSIPTKAQKSITHMEFDWAREKWATQQEPPVAVFSPHPHKGTAAKELQEAADALLPKTKIGKKRHFARLSSFHDEVLNTWHLVRTFENQQNLLHHILVRCSLWRGLTLGAAARGKTRVEEKPQSVAVLSEAEFGLLGRKKQFDAVNVVVTDLVLQPTVPSCALLVSGNEDAGHQVFLQQLLQTSTLLRSRPTRLGRPPHDQYDVAVLISWVAKVLGLAGSGPVLTLQDLAQRIAAELKHQPLCFALDQIHRLSGGVLAFQQQFWLPLYDLLREARARFHNGHRLFAIVADYTDETEPWKNALCEPTLADAPIDYQRLLLLPRLTNFSKTDVARWLMDVRGMKDDGSGRLGQVVENVLCNVRGEPDPTPSRVFRRLQDENLWPEDEES